MLEFSEGTHSAIVGPSKYGILPEILPLDRLSWGNGLIELFTFLGIILGTTAATPVRFAEAAWAVGALAYRSKAMRGGEECLT